MISGLVDQIATMLESCDVENLRKAIKDYLDTVLQKIATMYQQHSSLIATYNKEQLEVCLNSYSSMAQPLLVLVGP